MIKLYNFDELKPEEILNRDIRAEKNVEDVVDGIIADVRARGDEALKDYALKFDGAVIENLQVTQEEIDEAFAGMDPYFLETLRQAAANIENFHRQQVHKNFVVNDKPGIVLGQKYTPIEKAGVYVPGGTAAYPSTVLMDVIPAKVAGVAEIVSACAELLAHPEIPHRAIAVCFTPDEEIGRGADHFDRAKFPAPVAYTVDGGELGEIEYENFNAAAAELTVHGLNIHPGEAKNKMKNAVLMANQFLSLLPPAQTPAHTEGYEGFYHVCAMEGDESLARVQLIVRDYDRKKFETRKDFLRRTADYLNTVWGAGSFELTVRDSYYNMKEKVLPHMDLIENAQAAMRAADVAPRIVAIRGGTDGARLSWEGLPCPNLSTGGLNFHSIHEYIPVESLQKMTRVLVALARA